jgi:hypothetical protein
LTEAIELPDSVYFVGSIALDSVAEVFRVCGTTLGRRLKRIPDGEPGGRRLWISWPDPLLRASPCLAVNAAQPSVATGFFLLRLADGVKDCGAHEALSDAVPADVELGIHLCYGDWEARHFVEPQEMGPAPT